MSDVSIVAQSSRGQIAIDDFRAVMKESQAAASEAGLTEDDVTAAIKTVRLRRREKR